jgi:hypothetical protein
VNPDTNTPRKVTVGEAQGLLDQLYAASSVAREYFNRGEKANAISTLADYYSQLGQELSWFEMFGAPTSAYNAYVQLFGEAPA